jgi:hypothetical protein
MGREDVSRRELRLVALLNRLLVKLGGHCGYIAPQIATVLQKP